MEDFNKILTASLAKGAVLGILLIIYTLLVWVFDIHIFSFIFGISSFVIIFGGEIAYTVIAEKNFRNSIGGKITFMQLFTYGFIMLLVAGLMNLIFTHFLYHNIDPEYLAKQADYAYDSYANLIKDQDSLDKVMENFDQSVVAMQNTLSSLLKVWIGPMVLSLIFALFIKKDINELN